MNQILKFFLQSRILFLLFAFISSLFIPLREGYLGRQFDSSLPYLAWVWANFDGRHYLEIATHGYYSFNFAFFPLYSLIIGLINRILIFNPLYIGIFISLVCFILSMIMIYKIILLDYKEDIARLSVLLLSFFPLAFFYHSVYADSLFLLLTTVSFYFFRQNQWFWSGIFGALSTLTRLAGLALLPALLVEWYLQNRALVSRAFTKFDKKTIVIMIRKFINSGFIALILTFCGFLSYLLYLQIGHGDWLLFQKSMAAWQQNKFILPPQTIFRYIKILLLVKKDLLVYWIAVFELTAFVLYSALSIYVWKKIRSSYGVFMIVLLLLVAFTGTFAGTPRYMLHLFPGFLAMALLLHKNTILRFLTILIFLLFGFILTGLFTRGYFIA